MGKINSETEKELVIYARITKPEGLKLAKAVIFQEQANIKTPKGSVRVRMHKKSTNAKWSFEMTTKTKVEGGDASIKAMEEATTTISPEAYEMFKAVTPDFMRKVRYIFPIEKAFVSNKGMSAEIDVSKLCYEVDVFIDRDGERAPWCKIDIEVAALAEELKRSGITVEDFDITARLGSLPLGLEAAFVDRPDAEDLQRQMVTKLYSRFFLRPTKALRTFDEESDSVPAINEQPPEAPTEPQSPEGEPTPS